MDKMLMLLLKIYKEYKYIFVVHEQKMMEFLYELNDNIYEYRVGLPEKVLKQKENK